MPGTRKTGMFGAKNLHCKRAGGAQKDGSAKKLARSVLDEEPYQLAKRGRRDSNPQPPDRQLAFVPQSFSLFFPSNTMILAFATYHCKAFHAITRTLGKRRYSRASRADDDGNYRYADRPREEKVRVVR
jgi:hypothetical protein